MGYVKLVPARLTEGCLLRTFYSSPCTLSLAIPSMFSNVLGIFFISIFSVSAFQRHLQAWHIHCSYSSSFVVTETNSSIFPKLEMHHVVFLHSDRGLERHRVCVCLRSPCDEPVTKAERGEALVGASERDGPLNVGNPLSPPLVSSKQTNGLRRFKQAASRVPASFPVPSAFPARSAASPSAQPLCLPYLPPPASGPLRLFFRVTASLSFSSVS